MDPKEVAETRQKLIFNQFYSPDILQKQFTERIFFFPALFQNMVRAPQNAPKEFRQTQIDRAYALFRTTKMEAAIEHYRKLHNPDYIERIQQLASQIPQRFFEQPKPTIVIAAMNELKTDQAIEAARSAYNGNFDVDLNVLVYHNYKSEPAEAVRQAITALRKYPNVAIVEERVAAFHTVACAKKVSSDLLQIQWPESEDSIIIMMDADVKGLSAGTIHAALTAMEDKLAASPGYNYDRAACAKFPVLDFIWQVADVSRQKKLDLDANTMKATIGPFTCTTRKALALIGGYKPVLIAGGEPRAMISYEDIQFSKDLSKATAVNYLYKDRHPVADLGAARFRVLLDASREIEALLRGRRFDERWIANKFYVDLSGSPRFNWRLIDITDPQIAAIPELSVATPENLEKALSNFLRDTVTSSLRASG